MPSPTTTRRAVLAGAAGLPALALPVLTAGETCSPVRVCFDHWKWTYTFVNERGIGDDEIEKRLGALGVAERAVFAEPARDATDVLWKIAVMTAYDFGMLAGGEDAQGITEDVRRLLGHDAEVSA